MTVFTAGNLATALAPEYAKAVVYGMAGQTVATVVGVPVASWLGQTLGWRCAFAVVVAVGMATLTGA